MGLTFESRIPLKALLGGVRDVHCSVSVINRHNK